jgi:glycosyltransferase involved in cell wall biosynthesis
MKISVIVPVYNPGRDIDDCIRTLLDQSLSADEYEVIFVDDGSTDDTPERLDELAGAHKNVQVFHIPNSGWPGRPRNVGMDNAQGEFVYFVDNDDWLSHEALERMYAVAVRDDADIVMGKVVGRGKKVPRGVFRRNRSGLTMADGTAPLALLSPHKLFRTSMLVEHGIRFPEGRRRLEDHAFVVHAYFHARSVSILADYPSYYWVLRDDRSNASAGRWDAAGYFGNLEEVLDIVEAHTEPGPLRDRLMVHWYRGKMLGRVGGPAFLRRDPAWRREIVEVVRKIALERFGPAAEEHLSFGLRVRSRVLREGTQSGLEALATAERQLRVEATVAGVTRKGDGLVVGVHGRMQGPLQLRQESGKVLWQAPLAVREALPDHAQFDVTEELAAAKVDVLLRSTADRAEYLMPTRTKVSLEPVRGAEGTVVPVLEARALVSPRMSPEGSVLPAGEWEVVATVNLLGFKGDAKVMQDPSTQLRLTTTPEGTATPVGFEPQSSSEKKSSGARSGETPVSVGEALLRRVRRAAKRGLGFAGRSPVFVRARFRFRAALLGGRPGASRVGTGGDRLLASPVFILSSVRSGSTLLRVILNTHSKIRSPHELHLRDVKATVKEGYPRQALEELGLDERKLTFLLWDRILHRELERSGKQILVNKTPSDVHIVPRILRCWPDARFIFLLRHPVDIARSRQSARRRKDSPERNLEMVLKYCEAVEKARRTYPGLTVRYEDLTKDPEGTTRKICHWLGVAWEPQMLDYQREDHGRMKPGFGDWTDKIRSGQIQPAPPPPPLDEIPEELRPLARAWGYLPPS